MAFIDELLSQGLSETTLIEKAILGFKGTRENHARLLAVGAKNSKNALTIGAYAKIEETGLHGKAWRIRH